MRLIRAAESRADDPAESRPTKAGTFDLTPHDGFPYHRHLRHTELIGVDAGSVELLLDGTSITLQARDFVVVERGEAHGLTAGDDGARGWFLKIPNLPDDRVPVDVG